MEGCWLAGLTPPNVEPAQMHPIINKAINILILKIQMALKNAIRSRDEDQLVFGIEMIQYSKIEGMAEERQ